MVHKIYTILFFAFSLTASMAQDHQLNIYYAEHFKVIEKEDGVKILSVINPWPNSNTSYEFALIPKDNKELKANYRDYKCIFTPVERMVLSSTTHIPSVVDLDKVESIVGFTGTDLISSKEVRQAVDKGQIKELGLNEKINIETAIALHPEVIIGFSINSSNKAYEELEAFGIPIVLNADWLEQSPLAKAEWVKFFGLFFNKEAQANTIFNQIEANYLEAKKLAAKAKEQPTLISGSLYKDVWYAPGKDSWAARFFKDANANYLFSDMGTSGSLSLSIEEAIVKGSTASFWIAPAQFTSYQEMLDSNTHYGVFESFKNNKVFTYALSKGETGGMLYFELAAHRPDLVLKDLISILHPQLLKNYQPTFFKPLLHE
jgi:iron complex transport system substrate-binding protein